MDIVPAAGHTTTSTLSESEEVPEPIDVMAGIESRMIAALRSEAKLMTKLESIEGAAWGSVKAFFLEQLPDHLDDRDQLSYRLVKKAMDEIFGVQDHAWETFKNPSNVTYIRKRA